MNPPASSLILVPLSELAALARLVSELAAALDRANSASSTQLEDVRAARQAIEAERDDLLARLVQREKVIRPLAAAASELVAECGHIDIDDCHDLLVAIETLKARLAELEQSDGL